jgi:adenylyltransferase/sulfurtransferase
MVGRYHRQSLLPFIGDAGQARLLGSRVLLVGCGALGSVVAEQLVRAGVGHLILVDRDLVEWTNLQRQTLFDETDARDGVPKAIAAARRLAAINSSVTIQPHVTDVHAGNVESFMESAAGKKLSPSPFLSSGANRDTGLRPVRAAFEIAVSTTTTGQRRASQGGGFQAEALERVDLIVDGTDNVETRYLLNDAAVKHGIPWVYGACVGTDGRMMTIRPGAGPCLRCVFPQPPGVGELATCDIAGVLGPAIAVVAGYQSAAAIKILSGNIDAVDSGLLTIDFWKNRHHTMDTGGRRAGCVCCEQREFQFLNQPAEASIAALCGRNSVQVRPAAVTRLDLKELAVRLASAGRLEASAYLLRLHLDGSVVLTIFPDGRCIVQGTSDARRARSLVSQYLGT